MSAVRCREGRLGKFTRPKDTWTGRRRGPHRGLLAGEMQRTVTTLGQSIAARQLGNARQRKGS